MVKSKIGKGPLLVLTLLLFFVYVLYGKNLQFILPFVRSIMYATNGLISPVLLSNLFGFVVIVGVCLLGFGCLSASSLGFIWGKLPLAAIIIAGTWIAGQIVQATASLIFAHRLVAATGNAHSLSYFIAIMFGVAMLEESIFRGYLIHTLLPYLRNSIVVAVLCSGIIFGVMHIFVNIAEGRPIMVYVFQILAGILFGWLYIRTENLWLCIGFHSFIDETAILWTSPIPYWLVPVVSIILCGWFGPIFHQQQEKQIIPNV